MTTMLRAALAPAFSMADLYGPGHAYFPRAHAAACDWLSDDPALLDSLTGNQLAIAGDMPVVCSAGSATPGGLELLEEAGFEPPRQVHPFHGASNAIDVGLGLVHSGGCKLVIQHAHPPDVLPAGAQWIDPALLRRLNDKANLADFVPAEFVPQRTVVSRAAFFASAPPALPFVLKAATGQSTGGGVAVVVCRSSADIAGAAKHFARCDRLVVEACLEIETNPCLHFAVLPDGAVRYLGYADQDVSEAGRYRGNWMRLGSVLPRAAVEVATQVIRRGAALGFRGIAGIDLVIAADGTVRVIDLNFRVNGSTAAVLLAPAIQRELGSGVMHIRGFRGAGTFDALISAARAALRRGQLLPLATFDPIAAGHPPQPPRLQAMVLAETQDQVLAVEAELAHNGLS